MGACGLQNSVIRGTALRNTPLKDDEAVTCPREGLAPPRSQKLSPHFFLPFSFLCDGGLVAAGRAPWWSSTYWASALHCFTTFVFSLIFNFLFSRPSLQSHVYSYKSKQRKMNVAGVPGEPVFLNFAVCTPSRLFIMKDTRVPLLDFQKSKPAPDIFHSALSNTAFCF